MMAFGAIASIAGGLLGAKGASDAADAQAAAAAQDIAFQRETRDLIFDRLDPFYTPGITAQNALAFELGLGGRPTIGGAPMAIETFTQNTPATSGSVGRVGVPGMPNSMLFPGRDGDERRAQATTAGTPATSATRYRVGNQVFNTMEEAQAVANANPTGGTAYQGFQATPGFQFALDQGNNSINALAGARGGLNSGRTLQDLASFNMGMANQEYNNFLNRLTGMSGQGFAAAGATANAATNAAAGVSNALGAQGNAAAAGAIGQSNAWTGALNNLTALNQYQRGVNQPGGNFLFGGNSWGR